MSMGLEGCGILSVDVRELSVEKIWKRNKALCALVVNLYNFLYFVRHRKQNSVKTQKHHIHL